MSVLNRIISKLYSRRIVQTFMNSTSKQLKLKVTRQITSFSGAKQYSSMNSGPMNSAFIENEKREFLAIYPDIVRVVKEVGYDNNIPEANDWVSKVLDYNVLNGSKEFGLITVFAYQGLTSQYKLKEENIYLARILGWCNELYLTFFMMADDMLDRAYNRKGLLCWYKHNDLGIAALNDTFLLEQIIYRLLQVYFKNMPIYVDLIDTFHDITLRTVMGQVLDMLAIKSGKESNYHLFTMEYYNAMVKNKAEYITFYMPFILGMQLAGTLDEKMQQKTKTLLLQMGHFAQVLDDYLDCYAHPKITEKAAVACDIEEGTCTWLATLALQRATMAQRKIFVECYGHHDKEKVVRIKELYNNLGLPELYATYAEENYNLMKTRIQETPDELHDVFFNIISIMHNHNGF